MLFYFLFVFIHFLDTYFLVDIFFPHTTYIRGMHGKRGVICPLFGYVSVCVLYLFYALSLYLIVSWLSTAKFNLYLQHIS